MRKWGSAEHVQAPATASAEDFWRDRHLQARNSFVTLQQPDSYH